MAYVGNWPTTIGFRTMNFKAVSDTKVTTSQSGRSVRVSTAGTRFAGTIQYPPMVVGNFKPIQAIATRLQGQLNSFDITLPDVSYNSNGAAYGLTATVDGATSAGATSVDVNTNKNSETIFYAGDVLKFASHNKVYMVVDNVTTDGTGAGTISITPSLFEDITDTSNVTVNAVPFRMRLERDIQEYRYATDGTVTYNIDMIEEI